MNSKDKKEFEKIKSIVVGLDKEKIYDNASLRKEIEDGGSSVVNMNSVANTLIKRHYLTMFGDGNYRLHERL